MEHQSDKADFQKRFNKRVQRFEEAFSNYHKQEESDQKQVFYDILFAELQGMQEIVKSSPIVEIRKMEGVLEKATLKYFLDPTEKNYLAIMQDITTLRERNI